MPPEARCTALPLRRQESPGRQSRRDLDFNHHITVKSASSAPLLIRRCKASNGCSHATSAFRHTASHGLSTRGAVHVTPSTFIIQRYRRVRPRVRGTAALRGAAAPAGAWRSDGSLCQVVGHTWARASTSTSTSAPRARALNGERKLYAAWERGRVDGSENHCALPRNNQQTARRNRNYRKSN